MVETIPTKLSEPVAGTCGQVSKESHGEPLWGLGLGIYADTVKSYIISGTCHILSG